MTWRRSGHPWDVRIDQRHVWRAVGTASGLAAGAATRRVLITLWRRSRGAEPPTNPAAPGVSWPEALAWTIASGVALGIARLVAQRGAAEAWRATTGVYPTDLDDVSP